MNRKPQKLEWRCIKQPHFYLIVCRCGVFELAETIERQLWGRTIERCLLLRRVVGHLKTNMANVIAAPGAPSAGVESGLVAKVASR